MASAEETKEKDKGKEKDKDKKKEEAAEKQPTKKKSKLKLLVIIGIALVVLGGGAAAAAVFLLPDHSEAKTPELDSKLPQGPGPRVSLDPFVVNLADTDISRYLKVTIEIELRDETSVLTLKARTTEVRDSMVLLLSSKTYSDIKPVQGKLKLKEEIVRRVNEIIGAGQVVQVYFTEFLVQP